MSLRMSLRSDRLQPAHLRLKAPTLRPILVLLGMKLRDIRLKQRSHRLI